MVSLDSPERRWSACSRLVSPLFMPPRAPHSALLSFLPNGESLIVDCFVKCLSVLDSMNEIYARLMGVYTPEACRRFRRPCGFDMLWPKHLC